MRPIMQMLQKTGSTAHLLAKYVGPHMLGRANGDKFAGARFCVALGTKSCLYNATFFMRMTNAPNLMHTFTLLPF